MYLRHLRYLRDLKYLILCGVGDVGSCLSHCWLWLMCQVTNHVTRLCQGCFSLTVTIRTTGRGRWRRTARWSGGHVSLDLLGGGRLRCGITGVNGTNLMNHTLWFNPQNGHRQRCADLGRLSATGWGVRSGFICISVSTFFGTSDLLCGCSSLPSLGNLGSRLCLLFSSLAVVRGCLSRRWSGDSKLGLCWWSLGLHVGRVGRGRNRTISWFSAIPVENNKSQTCVMTKGSISYWYHRTRLPLKTKPPHFSACVHAPVFML